jgi:hypothetical protein
LSLPGKRQAPLPAKNHSQFLREIVGIAGSRPARLLHKAKALESLRRAEQHHSNWLIYLPYDPRFDGLRSDREFKPPFQKAGKLKGRFAFRAE